MHSNHNLVPTTVVDKNGKTTTVHKKPQPAVAVQRFPQPKTDTSATVAQRITNLYAELKGGEVSHRRLHDTRNFVRAHYELEVLLQIEAVMAQGGAFGHGICQHIDEEASEEYIRETLLYYPLLGIEDYTRVCALTEALARYPSKVELHDSLRGTSEDQKAACAVMKLTHLIDLSTEVPFDHPSHPLKFPPGYKGGDEPWRYAVIRNTELVEYIKSHRDQVEQVSEIVAKHNVTDPNAIIGIMDGVIPALAEGAL